jgi:hypothetical protein
MQALAERILKKTRKNWLRTRPLFRPFKPVDLVALERAENKVGTRLPEDLKTWLLSVGYGDVDEVLSFRHDWFHAIDQGHLKSAVIFAQDELGNFYAFSPVDGSIHFFARSSPEYATVAPSFRTFMEELEHRDFKLGEWMDSLVLLPYDRDA